MRILAALLLLPGPALAAGGAHVNDDSEVEDPGHCHLEAWASSYLAQGYLANLAPACTLRSLPRLEVDGFVTRVREDGTGATTIGLGPKVTLRPQASGLGIGLSGAVAVDAARGRLGYAIVNLPVTLPLKYWLRVNLNAGAQWTRGRAGLDATGGVQVEVTPRKGPALMVEGFAHSGQPLGGQAGLRWTADRGRLDLDLLYARYVDGFARHALTLGLTLRR